MGGCSGTWRAWIERFLVLRALPVRQLKWSGNALLGYLNAFHDSPAVWLQPTSHAGPQQACLSKLTACFAGCTRTRPPLRDHSWLRRLLDPYGTLLLPAFWAFDLYRTGRGGAKKFPRVSSVTSLLADVCWHRWDLNPRSFEPGPEPGALDHSATVSPGGAADSCTIYFSLMYEVFIRGICTRKRAQATQWKEFQLPKLKVAGSTPVSFSTVIILAKLRQNIHGHRYVVFTREKISSSISTALSMFHLVRRSGWSW